MLTVIIAVCLLKSMCVSSFSVIGYCLNELHAICIPIIMYGLKLCTVVLQDLHCLPNCLHICMIRVKSCYIITKFHRSIPYGF